MEYLSLLAASSEFEFAFSSLGEVVLVLEGFVITILLILNFMKLSRIANKD